jgi:hypothetical protein
MLSRKAAGFVAAWITSRPVAQCTRKGRRRKREGTITSMQHSAAWTQQMVVLRFRECTVLVNWYET